MKISLWPTIKKGSKSNTMEKIKCIEGTWHLLVLRLHNKLTGFFDSYRHFTIAVGVICDCITNSSIRFEMHVFLIKMVNGTFELRLIDEISGVEVEERNYSFNEKKIHWFSQWFICASSHWHRLTQVDLFNSKLYSL